MLRIVHNKDRKTMTKHEYKGGRGARSIPPTERMEYRNALWLLENETDGTYGDFGKRIGKSRQEIGRLLRRDPQFGISRQMAMRIEEGFGKPRGWLSKDHGFPPPRSQVRTPREEYKHFPSAPVGFEFTAADTDFTAPNPNIADVGYSNHTYEALQTIAQVQERAADIVAMKTTNDLNNMGVIANVSVATPVTRSAPARALMETTTVFEVRTDKRIFTALIEDITLKGVEDAPSDDAVFKIARQLISASLAEASNITQKNEPDSPWLAVYNVKYQDKEYVIIMDEMRLGLALFDAKSKYKVDSLHELLEKLQSQSKDIFFN